MWTLQTASNQVTASRRPNVKCQGVAAQSGTRKAVRERILRYPDGMERRIVYPTAESSSETSQDVDYIYEYLPHDSFASAWQQRLEMQGGLSLQTQKKQTYNFNWAAVKKRAQALDQEVARSYQVLHGCPWVMPRSMYVITTSHNFMGAQQHFYTMRVRVPKSQEVTDELARVLGNLTLASSISMSDMLDGVVAFSSREQAERFVGKMMDEDSASNMDAHICELTSHELFKMSVTEAKGCVVAVGFSGPVMLEDTYIPSPSQLSTSLRGISTA